MQEKFFERFSIFNRILYVAKYIEAQSAQIWLTSAQLCLKIDLNNLPKQCI
jgi:hypothetical protein